MLKVIKEKWVHFMAFSKTIDYGVYNMIFSALRQLAVVIFLRLE